MRHQGSGPFRTIAIIAIIAVLISSAFNIGQAIRNRSLLAQMHALSTNSTITGPGSASSTPSNPNPTSSTSAVTIPSASLTTETSAAIIPTPTPSLPAKPTVTPTTSPELPTSAAILLQRLAAALTGEQLAAFPTATRLEDRTTYPLAAVQKYVYLTFDDGPSQYTPKLLEILQKNHVRATFFVRFDADQDHYRQIVAAGHTLALHTYSHDYAQIYASETAFFDDLNRISAYVKGITGIDSKIVRLAGGSSNTISRNYSKGVVTRIVARLNREGYVYFDWNAQGMDATTPGIAATDIVKNVKGFTYVNGVAKPFIMLLLHNGIDEPTTPDALQAIIDYYRSLDYQFEKITMETPVVHQPIQN